MWTGPSLGRYKSYKGGVEAMLIWIIVAVISVALLGSVLLASKGGARWRDRTGEMWSETEVKYKARHDLIPKLEETLKGYAFHQSETFEAVAAERAGAFSARAVGGRDAGGQNRGDM